jgi:hypothetical protein
VQWDVCPGRSVKDLKEEIVCLSKLVSVLTTAVAEASVTGNVLTTTLTVEQKNVINGVPASGASPAAGGAHPGVKSRAVGDVNDGRTWAIVGSILGAAAIAAVIVALSVVRKKKAKAALETADATTPLLETFRKD